MNLLNIISLELALLLLNFDRSFYCPSFKGITLFFPAEIHDKIGEIDWGVVVIEIDSAYMSYPALLFIVL